MFGLKISEHTQKTPTNTAAEEIINMKKIAVIHKYLCTNIQQFYLQLV